MASKLGSLTLDLIARVGDFVGPIQQAENQSNSSFSNMRDHVNKYGAAVAGAATAVAIGLAAMTSEYVEQAAELERMAFRSNATTQEFQRLAVGAEAFGVEAETLSGQLKDFNEKLGELTTLGSGAGIDFFEQIAMKTEGGAEGAKKLILQMQKLSGPEALQLYIDKLEEAGVSHQQMSFYLESMGGDLTDLIPLFINGGEAAKIYGDAAERAGLIMSENTIQQTKILKEQVYLLDLQMQGAKNQLMQAVIPAFVDISNAFFGGSEQGLQFSGVANGIAKTLKGLAAMAMGTVATFQLVGKTLGGLAAIGSKLYENANWYEMTPLGLTKVAFEARNEIAALSQEIKVDLGATIESTDARLDRLWDGAASGTAKKLAEVRQLSNGQIAGLDDLVKKKEEEAAASDKAQVAAANKALTEKKAAEAKYQHTALELKMLQRVADLSAKHNVNEIGAKYGIPHNILPAVMAQESGGNVNARSPEGAIGPFQTTGIYRKHYGLSVADSYDTAKVAEVAAKDISASYKVLGNWKDAITAYNAGLSGTQSLLKTGFTKSAAKTKEAKEYAGLVNKWFVGLNGSTDLNSGFINTQSTENLKERETYNNALAAQQEKLKDLQLQIHAKYRTEVQSIDQEHFDAVKAITLAFADDESSRNKYLELQRIAYEKDVAEFKNAQLQKQYDAINSFKAMQEQIKGLSSGADDIFAKATMSADDYNLWSLKNNRDTAKKSLKEDRIQTEQSIMTSDVYKNGDERYQALLDTYQEYRNGMAAIDVQYHEQVKELAIAQRDTQLAMWSGILSNAQTTLSQLTQSAKEGAGEQSAIYRTMFALQQGFSVASSLVAAYTAYTQAFADPSAMTLPQKFAGAAAVMAALTPALATISSVAINGMAHDGIDSIPQEGTWLLDKGERVVDSRTNGDLKNFLSEKRSSAQTSQVSMNPQIIITDERESIADYMSSRAGEQLIMRTLKRNGIAR